MSDPLIKAVVGVLAVKIYNVPTVGSAPCE